MYRWAEYMKVDCNHRNQLWSSLEKSISESFTKIDNYPKYITDGIFRPTKPIQVRAL